MYKFVFEIEPEDGEKKTITVMDKRGYDFEAGKKIRDMIEMLYGGKATFRIISKEHIK